MLNIFTAIKTVATIGKTIAEVKKEIKNTKKALKNDMIPIKKYVEEPNENNVDIGKMKDDIIFLKNQMKQLKSKKKTDDKKWYDE